MGLKTSLIITYCSFVSIRLIINCGWHPQLLELPLLYLLLGFGTTWIKPLAFQASLASITAFASLPALPALHDGPLDFWTFGPCDLATLQPWDLATLRPCDLGT